MCHDECPVHTVSFLSDEKVTAKTKRSIMNTEVGFGSRHQTSDVNMAFKKQDPDIDINRLLTTETSKPRERGRDRTRATSRTPGSTSARRSHSVGPPRAQPTAVQTSSNSSENGERGRRRILTDPAPPVPISPGMRRQSSTGSRTSSYVLICPTGFIEVPSNSPLVQLLPIYSKREVRSQRSQPDTERPRKSRFDQPAERRKINQSLPPPAIKSRCLMPE